MKIIALLVLFLLNAKGYAQSPEIALELNVEGEKVAVREGFMVGVVSGADTLPLITTSTGFYIPDSLCNKKRTIILNINHFEMSMDTPLIWQKGLPLWSISVDLKPLDGETIKMIPKSSRRKTKWVYTLNKTTGSSITYYRFQKPKIQ